MAVRLQRAEVNVCICTHTHARARARGGRRGVRLLHTHSGSSTARRRAERPEGSERRRESRYCRQRRRWVRARREYSPLASLPSPRPLAARPLRSNGPRRPRGAVTRAKRRPTTAPPGPPATSTATFFPFSASRTRTVAIRAFPCAAWLQARVDFRSLAVPCGLRLFRCRALGVLPCRYRSLGECDSQMHLQRGSNCSEERRKVQLVVSLIPYRPKPDVPAICVAMEGYFEMLSDVNRLRIFILVSKMETKNEDKRYSKYQAYIIN